MAWIVRLIWALLALMAFFLAALAVNQQPLSLHFLNWQTPTVSVFWWLLAAFAAGLLLGLLGITVVSARHRLRERGLNKRLHQAQTELQRVRNATLHE